MFKRKLTISDYLLIVVNLIPIYGVWFEGWNPKMIFVVYCLETVIIGLVNVVKMAIVTVFIKSTDQWQANGTTRAVSGLFFILFFIVHYGFFIFVQTQIFFAIGGMGGGASTFGIYKAIPEILGPQGKLLLAIFVTYYTLQTFFSFFSTGQYKTISMMKLMFQPYLRIFVQQFIVILGSFFILFGAGKIFIVIFAGVKIYFELFINFDKYMEMADNEMKKEKSRINN